MPIAQQIEAPGPSSRWAVAAAPVRPARGGYRPCFLTWVHGEPGEALLLQMRHAAERWDRRNRLIPLALDEQVLLVAGGLTRSRLREAVRSVLDVVEAGRPDAEVHTVVGDRLAPGDRFAAVASRLRRLGRYADARGGDPVVWARRLSLGCLLETLDPRQATAFVEDQLAVLDAHDREHGTNLQRVLELALDHESRSIAAREAYMHRNTFRRQLAKALELIDVDLSCPEERLALHVALKLRGLGPPSSPAAP